MMKNIGFGGSRSRSVVRFLLRLAGGVLLVSFFFIFTQDIQIFPGTLMKVTRVFSTKKDDIPPGVAAHTIHTPDGVELESWFLSCTTECSDQPIFIIFHGNAEDVASTYRIQRWLQRNNFSSYSFDYRGYRNSTGWPSDKGIKLDVASVLNFVLSRHPDQDIVVFGISVGSGLAAYASTLRKVKAVVLLAPYSSLRRVASDLALFGFLAPFVWYDLDTVRFLEEGKFDCLFVAHGDKDSVIKPYHSEHIRDVTMHVPYRSIIFEPETGHNDILTAASAKLIPFVAECKAQPIGHNILPNRSH